MQKEAGMKDFVLLQNEAGMKDLAPLQLHSFGPHIIGDSYSIATPSMPISWSVNELLLQVSQEHLKHAPEV